MEKREQILDEIVERELAMFLATPNEGGTASCQERPKTFRLMRRMAHSSHQDEFLLSYLNDLRAAEKAGRNFMLEKYGRMDDRLPPLSTNPLLDKIADAETEFLDQAARELPDMIRLESLENFRRYLRCELETLSDASLELYHAEILKARAEGRNPVLQRHKWLAEKLGKAV